MITIIVSPTIDCGQCVSEHLISSLNISIGQVFFNAQRFLGGERRPGGIHPSQAQTKAFRMEDLPWSRKIVLIPARLGRTQITKHFLMTLLN